ncbi:MAG: CRISPR-associated endonuclease Cas2 [Patescibacteria group bacterium]
MDIAERNLKIKRQRRERRKGIWCGPTQKKILLLLLGGMVLSCTRSNRKQLQIVKGIHETWKDLSKQAAIRAVSGLYESKLLEAGENTDGTITLTLNKKGKRRALTYHPRYAKIRRDGSWDHKWRLVLYDIPEDERQTRNAFRDHLTDLGLHKLQHSVSIFPFDCKNEIDFFVELLDIRKYVRFIVADSIDDQVYWKRKFNLDKYI